MTSIKELSQARYERQLLSEITKLQAALAEERNTMAADKANSEMASSMERERKAADSDKASRLLEMEKAIEAAQKVEQKEFLKKREVADKRMQAKEAAAAKQRTIDAKKKEQQRALAQKLHEEQLARAAEERRQADESKRLRDEQKEAKLRQRMAAEKAELLERNLKKSEEAAEKVHRAAEHRTEATKQQRAQYGERMVAQQKRFEMQRQAQEKRVAEIKEAGELKKQVIERTQQQMLALDAQRRTAILNQEAMKQARMDIRAREEAEARAKLQQERVYQEAASRGRVERTMGDLQAQLSALEGQLDARQDRLEDFTGQRDRSIVEGQHLSVASSLERASLTNSMSKMRSNLTNTATLYLEVPTDRRQVQNRELKALLDRVDPDGDGHISLASMRKTLTKLLPPPPANEARPKKLTSASLPSLLTLEQRQTLSQYDQYVAAFKAVDQDNSGTISKRELYDVLRKAGLTDSKQALELFDGFDRDSDGSLDFEEFLTIAKVLC